MSKTLVMTVENMRQELIHAEETRSYISYGADIATMTEEEVKVAYINMRNYLSDTRTHD